LLHQRAQVHHVVGHRCSFRKGVGLATRPYRKAPMTAALPSYTTSGDVTEEFRLRVAASDGRHIAASCSGIVNVCHKSGSLALAPRADESLNMRQHDPRDLLKNRDSHRVAKLLLGLGI
ncbi:hypothetical protein, partial [Aminobacter sp. J15]|uniref:hypothetical protein n=1 Tax=Aminobacter sp. J15 TaxID=935260 RepID=UPI002484BFF4